MSANKFVSSVICIVIMFFSISVYSETVFTKRVPQIENSKVHVWKTIIYSTKSSQLSMHRHDNDRVVVALTNGLLKVTNDKNNVHYLKLKKGMSYYLEKDPVGELHTDENMSSHTIEVIVI